MFTGLSISFHLNERKSKESLAAGCHVTTANKVWKDAPAPGMKAAWVPQPFPGRDLERHGSPLAFFVGGRGEGLSWCLGSTFCILT